jgi:predicted nucleic acid-binding protein
MKEKSLKLYLENSVISMYLQDDDPYRRDLTRQFWKEVLPEFHVYISDMVIREIGGIKDNTLRRITTNLIKTFTILEETPQVIRLSDTYLSVKRMPRGDALHLAFASLGEMNVLVTWNSRHLFKPSTQEMLSEVNIHFKLHIPIILTPEKFFEFEGEV